MAAKDKILYPAQLTLAQIERGKEKLARRRAEGRLYEAAVSMGSSMSRPPGSQGSERSRWR